MTSDFDRIIKTFRKHFNLTQTELAEAIGTRQSTIVRWENGAEPRVDGFRRLADFARSKGYNIESPWDTNEHSLLLVGRAKKFGEIIRLPETSSLPDIPVELSISGLRMNKAIQIAGNKLEPRFVDGDLACFNSSASAAAPAATGIALVSFADGPLHLQTVDNLAATQGLWLDATTGLASAPEWVGTLVAIVPTGAWSLKPRGLPTRAAASTKRRK